MMFEKNYIELFQENRALVERGSSGVMNALRDRALESLKTYGLPSKKLEEYLHTDVSAWFEPDWGMNLARLDMPVDMAQAFRCNVPNLSTLMYFLANDSYAESHSASRVLPDGVIAGSLKEISDSNPELVSEYYGRLADLDKTGTAAFNTLFAQDGFMVYVPDGVCVEKPLQLVTLLQSKVDLLVNRRILVVLGRGAQLKMLLCDHALSANSFLSTQVIEVFAGQDSRFELYDLEETHTRNHRVSELYIRQEAGSWVHADSITLNNGSTRNSSFVTLAGRGASLSLNGAAIADSSQHVDNLTFVDHREPDCTSSELFKYVLDGQSTGAFAGKVLVRPGSQRTVSQQTNRNICLTRQARMFTQPQLEIYADDVKCSHGSTVGQLDDNAMFYMRQRGISEKEARMLLMLAFVAEVIGMVELDALRDRLTRLVEKRFRGELSQCEGCRACR
ncbi:MAG: Fe-S cluster assembly protein SufD [Bacteroidetes bacterium]|nr:Fe-S cluster assembly protein SufD [Candidatus Colenecus caballi]